MGWILKHLALDRFWPHSPRTLPSSIYQDSIEKESPKLKPFLGYLDYFPKLYHFHWNVKRLPMNVLGDYEINTQQNDTSRLPLILLKQQRAIKHVISTSWVWQAFPRTLQGTCDFKNGITYQQSDAPQHCHKCRSYKIDCSKIVISTFMFLTILFFLVLFCTKTEFTIFVNLGLYRHFETVTSIRTWINHTDIGECCKMQILWSGCSYQEPN
jgi:hypothetical protein